MALPPSPAIAPTGGAPGGAPPDPAAMGGAPPMAPDDTGGDAGEDTGGGEHVVCTIVSMGDGTYKLYHGDEPEEGGGEEPPEAPEADVTGGGGNGTTATPPEGASDMTGGEDTGETFDSVGPLLKAVLDCIKSDHEASGGETEQSSFEGGFNEAGGGAPAPTEGGRKATM